MSKAKTEALEALHAKLALELADAMEPVETTDEEGKTKVVRASASILNVARQFLKDNGIDSTVADDSPLGNLAGRVSKYLDEDAQGEAVN